MKAKKKTPDETADRRTALRRAERLQKAGMELAEVHPKVSAAEHLAGVDELAKDILHTHGVLLLDLVPPPKGYMLTAFGLAVKMPRGARALIVDEAMLALNLSHQLRSYLDRGHIEWAVLVALQLGINQERMRVLILDELERKQDRSKGGKVRRQNIGPRIDKFKQDVLAAYAAASKRYSSNAVSESFKYRQVVDTVKKRDGRHPSEETVRTIIKNASKSAKHSKRRVT